LPVADDLAPAARDAIERIAYSPAEAAEALGVTRQHVYHLIERGELRRFHVGRCARIPVADVLALVGGEPPRDAA
jgi:excisionase family DNA binding protein